MPDGHTAEVSQTALRQMCDCAKNAKTAARLPAIHPSMERLIHPDRNGYARRILRVQHYIADHLDRELSLEELAEVAHLSAFHFHRIFSGMTGETVKSYVRRLRIERAATLLTYTDRSVTDIGFDAGYGTPASFVRAFRGIFDQAPSAYRTMTRARSRYLTPREAAPADAFERDRIVVSGQNLSDIRLSRIPEFRAACVRHVGPYELCEPAWERLCGWAAPLGLLSERTTFVGISHDDPDVTPPELIRYDACIDIPPEITPPEDMTVRILGGVTFLTAIHKGSYRFLHDSYRWLCGKHIPENGYEYLPMQSHEHYLNTPDSVPEEELLVKICIPVRER